MVVFAGERSKLSSILKFPVATTLSLHRLTHENTISPSLSVLLRCYHHRLLLSIDTAGCGPRRVVSDDAVFARPTVFLREYAYMSFAIVYYMTMMMAIFVS